MKIIQRSKRQSAACQSGKRLFPEYDWKQRYYPHKSEIVHTEILRPPNAPPEYADRNTLWNALTCAPMGSRALTSCRLPAASQMEKRGIKTNIGSLNRDRKEANRLIQSVQEKVQEKKARIKKIDAIPAEPVLVIRGTVFIAIICRCRRL